MRDPNRIDPLLAKVAEAWKKYPDLRFGQFMSNFFGACNRDPFYFEDDAWDVALHAYIDGKDPGEAMDTYLNQKWRNEFPEDQETPNKN